MKKGDARSFRFNERRLNFVKDTLKLETKQEVLDYLIDEFWFRYNNGLITPAKANVEVPKWDLMPKPRIRRSFENYQQLVNDCEHEDEYRKLVDDINADEYLTTKQRNLLLKR